MEGFEALQALDRSRRKVWFGLVGSPAIAWLWADTIELSRQFGGGRVSPPPGTGPITFLWFYFSLGIERLIGRAGLHAVFGCLVAIAAGVGLRGWAQRRDLDRRGVTARALRHEWATRLAWPRAAAETGARLEVPSGQPATVRGISAAARLLLLARPLAPVLSIAATVFFAWLALAR
jgi:hypothetical protein